MVVGYVVGVFYEILDIVLCVVLIYLFVLDMYFDGIVGDIDVVLLQSVNLDFQIGIVVDMLVFVNICWVDWIEVYIIDILVGNFVDYDNDIIIYLVGIGCKFLDVFLGLIIVGYEEVQGGVVSNLLLIDGYLSLLVGGVYMFENGMKILGGICYVDIGDVIIEIINVLFIDNSVLVIGLKISISF